MTIAAGLTKSEWYWVLAVAVGIFALCFCCSAVIHKKHMHDYHKRKHELMMEHLTHVQRKRGNNDKLGYTTNPAWQPSSPSGDLRHPGYAQKTKHGRDSGEYEYALETHKVLSACV